LPCRRSWVRVPSSASGEFHAGRRLNSPALVADGNVDGFVSLSVLGELAHRSG
jgi:hypothetical protein